MENDEDIRFLQKLATDRVRSLGSFFGKRDLLKELVDLEEQSAYIRQRLLAIIKNEVQDSVVGAKRIKRQHDLLIRFLIFRDIVFGDDSRIATDRRFSGNEEAALQASDPRREQCEPARP